MGSRESKKAHPTPPAPHTSDNGDVEMGQDSKGGNTEEPEDDEYFKYFNDMVLSEDEDKPEDFDRQKEDCYDAVLRIEFLDATQRPFYEKKHRRRSFA